MLKGTFHFLHIDVWAELSLDGNFWLMSVHRNTRWGNGFHEETQERKKKTTYCVWCVLEQNHNTPIHLANPFPSNEPRIGTSSFVGQYLSVQSPHTYVISPNHHCNTCVFDFRRRVSVFLPRWFLCTGALLGLQFLKEVTLCSGKVRLLWVWGPCFNTLFREMPTYRGQWC